MKKRLISAMLIAAAILSLFSFPITMAESGGSIRSEQADFVFVIDSTGSMGSYISAVRNNLSAFVRELDNRGVDLRISIIDYKDIHVDGAASTRTHLDSTGSHWFTDVDEVVRAFNGITASGGGDDPETPDDAFARTLNEESWGWRSDASKYIFLLTDAKYKLTEADGKHYDAIEVCTTHYRRLGISVSVVSKLAFEPVYQHLYSLTGGVFMDIDSDDYYTLMLSISDWVMDVMGDTDKDGIPDEWETEGADVDGDGTIDLDFPAMGADPLVPDIFVEVDWMYRPEKTEKWLFFFDRVVESEINLRPTEAAMRTVYESFSRQGINLHIDAGPDSIDYVTGRAWGANSGGNSIEYKDVFFLGPDNNTYEYWNNSAIANFRRERWTTFRYCMFINKFQNSDRYNTGIAENIPGQFFIVCKTSSDRKCAGTFMHELGHTLGLQHGGNDEERYKSNYLSVMNYLFQLSGLVGTNAIDYSHYELPSLNESALDEHRGFDPDRLTEGTGLGTKIGNRIIRNIAGAEVDFNGDWFINDTPVSCNLNKDNDREDVLAQSINDWLAITFKGGMIGGRGAVFEEAIEVIIPDPGENHPLRIEDELSEAEAEELGIADNPEEPTEPTTMRGCAYCGKVHSDTKLGRIIAFVHKSLYFAKSFLKNARGLGGLR